MKEAKVISIGEHRGSPRLWLEGQSLGRAGFVPAMKIKVSQHKDGVLVEVAQDGDRVVSKKGVSTPVLDINSRAALAGLEGCKAVRVVFGEKKIFISPLASEKRRVSRLKRLLARVNGGDTVETGGVCAGGGILSHAVHAGLEEAGLTPALRVFNEIREDLVEQALTHNEIVTDETVVLNMPIQEAAFDAVVMERVGAVDILELGLPCSGASPAGRAKNKNPIMEAHEHVGHLVVGGLNIIARLNPSVVIFENVPAYEGTASAELIRKQLRDWGYEVHERLLDARDFDTLEKRVRWCLVGMTRGIEFSFDDLVAPGPTSMTVSDILQPMAEVEDRWSEMTGLKAKQERDIAAGKGFMMQIYDGSEGSINTLTKGIAKNRSTDPKIQHPENPDLLRIPTALEHARCKGIPAGLVEGLSQTTAHELLGQSICYKPFKSVAKLVGEAIQRWAADTKAVGFDGRQFHCAA